MRPGRVSRLGPICAAALFATALPTVCGRAAGVPQPAASPSPCPATLEFAGALYLDADHTVPESEVGPRIGSTDPDPAPCGVVEGAAAYQHLGHLARDELIYRSPDGAAEIFRSAGQTGFPMASVLRWVVLALVLVILLYAALPALYAHLSQPPTEVGDPQTGAGGELPSTDEPGTGAASSAGDRDDGA